MSDYQKLGGFPEAFAYAKEVLSELTEGGSISELRDCSIPHFLIDHHPEIEAVGKLETRFYRVSDYVANLLAVGAVRSELLFDIATEICAANLFCGQPIPGKLKAFASLLLRGKIERPKVKGRPAGNDFMIQFVLRDVATSLVDIFDIKLTRNPASPEISACDAVAEAANDLNYYVAPDLLMKWCNGRQYRDFRTRADLMDNILTDGYLIRTGILKPRL